MFRASGFQARIREVTSMKRSILTFAFVMVAGSIAWGFADDAVKAAMPAHKAVQLAAGPELESATDSSAIIRWTAINPGGTALHYGVVHYGTDARNLTQVAQSPQPFASRHDFPRAHHEPQFEYHLLLQGGIDRRHRRERWRVQSGENLQDAVALGNSVSSLPDPKPPRDFALITAHAQLEAAIP